LEYEEKITDIFSKETAELIIGAFSLLDNVKKIDVHFRLGSLLRMKMIINLLIVHFRGMFISLLPMTNTLTF